MNRADILAPFGINKWQHWVGLGAGVIVMGLAIGYAAPAPVQEHASTSPEATKSAPLPTVRLDGPQASLALGDLALTLAIAPQPVRLMTEQDFTVTVAAAGQPVTDAAVQVDLAMPDMYMGDNRVTLRHAGGGRYTGMGVFPTCSSGNTEWLATVSVRQAKDESRAGFQLTVGR